MKLKNQILLFSSLLIISSLCLIIYKIVFLGFPLFQDETQDLWNIEAKVSFKGKDESAKITLKLPKKQNNFIILNEESSSINYGYTSNVTNSFKEGVWSKRMVEKEKQTLYYSIDVLKDKYQEIKPPVIQKDIQVTEVPKPTLLAAHSITDESYKKSADPLSFASILIQQFNSKNPSQAVSMIKNHYMKTDKNRRDTLLQLLYTKNIKAHEVEALPLEDKKKNISINHMFEIFYKNQWHLFDIKKGLILDTSNIFIWQRGSSWLLETEGVKNPRVSFSISKNIIPARTAAISKDVKNQSTILDFSLFELPNASQNAFKLLLLVPLGALVVVIMRVIVGLKTSGTFMPILLAMAFIETQLIPGIAMFILVVTIGLIVRSYLSHLNLLLVARISSVVIVVVAIMAFVAILSAKLNLEYATSITFFPMIILAWTIERMSIIWEEDGPKEVIQQGSGSLLVAILAYFTMTNDFLSFLTFNFPEVLLLVLGLIILLGRYSGYRLSELYRFKSMVQ